MSNIQKNEKLLVARGDDFAVAGRHESKVFPDGSSLVRCEQVPWTTWAMEGSEFKLLYINRAHSMFTALIRMEGGLDTPDHHHFGEAHAFVIEGDFSYEYGTMYQGDYIVEAGGINHKPSIGEGGATFFVVFYGGLSGVGEDGLPEGEIVDVGWMYRAAAANGAADHLPPPPHQEINNN
jgi:2,4'-dihydroxyacetophenone dioxygenase|tara:strand:- start:30379 stop:30915 length:537 start_codon:yes stop_codon:yes gene_type:complete